MPDTHHKGYRRKRNPPILAAESGRIEVLMSSTLSWKSTTKFIKIWELPRLDTSFGTSPLLFVSGV